MLKQSFEGDVIKMVDAKPKLADEEKKKPIKVFRSGSVKGTIWENDFTVPDTKPPVVKKTHSTTIIRSYKDNKSDEWKETNSYTPDSLADLELVAKSCREYLKLKDK